MTIYTVATATKEDVKPPPAQPPPPPTNGQSQRVRVLTEKYVRSPSPMSMARIAIVVIGLATISLGLHSHYRSDWTNNAKGQEDSYKLYRICEKLTAIGINAKCPDITLERYFIFMILACFILSFVLLIASYLVDLSNQPLKSIDFGLQVVFSILIFSAAVAYITSTEQIQNLERDGYANFSEFNLRSEEKVAASALTILQAVFYGVVAFLIWRR